MFLLFQNQTISLLDVRGDVLQVKRYIYTFSTISFLYFKRFLKDGVYIDRDYESYIAKWGRIAEKSNLT